MDAKAVGPIRFERDTAKSFLRDESFREFGAGRVKLMRAMRGFADQNALGFARQFTATVIARLQAGGCEFARERRAKPSAF